MPPKNRLYEFARCARHNLLHLKWFHISFDGKFWHARDRDGLDLKYPFYPYLTALEIEGYLRQGQWKLEPGMVVIDAGGCYAEFTLYAARKVGPSGRVIMLEPDAKNLERAQEVFALNGGMPEHVNIRSVGLWKQTGKLSFASGLGATSQIVEMSSETNGASITQIAVESLADVVSRTGIERLDLVKMDIEGAELEAMETARPVIDALHPRFSIASYHVRNGQKTSEALEPLFRHYGYAAETGFQSHPTTWAWPTAR